MFWANELIDQLLAKKPGAFRVDDMKTPSGRIHVGALRGVVIHGLIHQLLREQGKRSVFTYVYNDMDPMDGFPAYLPEEYRAHMGKPLFRIPSPEKGFESLAECYAAEFQAVIRRLGFSPKVLWSSRMYQEGLFDGPIRTVLEKADQVRSLYKTVSGYDKPEDWYPFQVICPGCGRVGSTIVTGWDGKEVTYECRPGLVTWSDGCGRKGKVSPFRGTGKLMWKVDWAAHWKVIGVTIEGAGKDHMTRGGSYDLSRALCEKIFDYPAPHSFLYEWFLAKGGKKMSSSKGIGVSAKEVGDTLPPEILRYLLIATPYWRAIVFDPADNKSLLELFDRYDESARAYWEGGDERKARIFELSQVGQAPAEMFLPRLQDLVTVVQDPKTDLYQWARAKKGGPLKVSEKRELEKRAKCAAVWLKSYAPEKAVFRLSETVPKEADTLAEEQKKYLRVVASLLEKEWHSPDELQTVLYEKAKDLKLSGKEAFAAIYLALIGKKFGPKAAWFLLAIGPKKVIKRLKEVTQ